jgi:hypothetical protein
MLNIFTSAVKNPSKQFSENPRQSGEDNLQWLARVMPANDKNYTDVVMLGGSDLAAFRLRVAQSQLRHDLTPSSWSHVILLGDIKKNLANSVIHEISLDPLKGFGFPVPVNCLQRAKLGNYRDQVAYPNIAHIRVPVVREKVTAALSKYQRQRAVLDGPQLVLLWLGYIWGAGRVTNPLADSQGMPSAAMIEVVIGSAGFDLTPGLESRSSCPEAIWQSAKWWYDYYEKDKGKECLTGAFSKEHDFLESEDHKQVKAIDAQRFAAS